MKTSTFKFVRINKFLYTSILLFLLHGVTNSFAATRYSVATGNWNSTSTWSATSGGSSGAAVPVAGDLVTVEGGFTVTVNANTASLGSLNINSGSSLNVSSNFTVSSTTIIINGTYINNSTGTITGIISVNASGTYQHNINGGTIPTATWNPASTCNVTGITSTTPTGFNQSFGNFIWNSNSSDIISTDGDMSVQGNFTLSQGIFALSNGQTRNLYISGNYIQTGGVFDFNRAGTTNFNKMYIAGDLTNTLASTPTNGSITTLGAGAQNGEIIFNGSGVQTVNFTKTDAAQWISYTIDASSNVRLASSLQLTGDNSSSIYFANFTVNGILDAGNFSISYLSGGTGATLFTLSSGATLITANTGGIDGSIPASNMTRTFSAGANYTYDGTSAQVTGASLTQNNPRGVTISNSAGVTFSAQTYMDYLDISSGSIVNLGTFTGHTASVLYLSGTAYTAGSWGSSSSVATNKADTCFAATVGYLTLTPVTQSYTTTTDIVIPCGVTSITVEAWGGGGQGGTRNSTGVGGGGGGGAYAKGDVTVTSGNTYTVTVGGGGTSQNGSQIPGGDSYFGDGTTVKAKGGNSVPYNVSTGSTGGSSSSSVGTTKYSGGTGANGSAGSYGGGGGSSAGTVANGVTAINATGATAPSGGGNGGNGRSSSNGNGSPGTPPGGGGGGAYRTTSTRNGGAGGNGLVNITYPTIIPTITLGSNPSVCQGSSSATLTYNATTGCPNQYIISFNATAKTAGFLNVDPTTLPSSPITISIPTGVTPATYNASLTVINSNGFHSSVYAITITVIADNWTGAVSTAWESSGNWCGGVPSSNTDVTIPLVSNQPIIGASITALCNNITISSGATVTIAAGTSPGSAGGLLTIGRTLTNNAGASGIVVKSSSSGPNGSLIFSQPGLNSSVQATIEMYSKAYAANSNPYSAYKWQFFGIPLHTMSPSPTFDGSYVRKYDESGTTSATRWVNQTNGSTLTSFDGYEITQPVAKTITFNGVLEVGDLSKQLSYTVADTSYSGQNLLSNPYASAIDITKLTFGSETERTVYLYNTGSLADWQTQTGSDWSPGQYVSIPLDLANATAPAGITREIPSMQGFLVKKLHNDETNLSNFTISIPYSSVLTKNTSPLRVRPPGNKGLPLTIIDVAGSRYSDRMWVYTVPTCTHGFDNGWDGEKFLGSSLTPQIYAMESDGDYQVNSVNDIGSTEIGFQAGEDSIYTLTFTNENVENHYSELYLLDLQDNKIVDILQSGTEYSFTAHPSTDLIKRFKIISSSISIDAVIPVSETENLKVFSSQNDVVVKNISDIPGELTLYDIEGRILQKFKFIANGVTTIPMNLPAGVYLAKGKTSQEEVMKRLLIRK